MSGLHKAEPLFFDGGDVLGEGPYWAAGRSRLYWFDIMDHELHSIEEHGGDHRVVRTQQKVHALAVASGSRAVCTAHKLGLAWLDLDDGSLEPIVNPEADMGQNLLNDARCDAAGRFWFGSIHKRNEPSGSLYSYSGEGVLTAHGGALRASNGIAFSPDGRTLYLADTYAGVYAFDFDAAAGSVSNQRMIFEADGKAVLPDGLTIDRDGCLWIAMALAGKVVRMTPNGDIDATVEVPSTFVTSCTFGGEGLDTLYITSARSHRPDAELAAQPHAGAVFAVRPGVRGFAETPFGAAVREPGAG